MKDEAKVMEQNYNRTIESNQYQTQDNSLKYRLNPDEVVQKIESYLRGGENVSTYDNDTKKIKTQFIKHGEAIMNEKGIQSVMNTIKSAINHMTVQANFTEKQYKNYLYKMHHELALKLIRSKKEFEIKSISTYHDIINNIMFFVEPFMSRTINNLEREGLMQTIREKFVSSSPNRSGAFWRRN